MARTSETAGELTRARPADQARVAAIMARAFFDDPEMVYAFPDVHERTRRLPWLIGLNAGYGLRYGAVYAAAGWAGAAIWLPPGRTRYTLWRMLRAGMLAVPLRLTLDTLRRLAALGGHAADLQRRHARGPHWYLAQVGVEPARQHQGIGSRLLRPMLARCDAERMACYLETANPANVGLYEHFGFVVVERVDPRGVVPGLWGMRREPGGA
jgi:ribosomal protein S18 acetylase RimI-like enzyme